MRNKLVLFYSLILLLGFSCENEKLIAPSPVDSVSTTIPQTPQGKLERLSYLNEVIKSHLSRNLANARSSESISLEESKWGIEALVNIHHTRRSSSMEKISTQSSTFTVSHQNGELSLVDFSEGYLSAYNALVEHYNTVSLEDKRISGLILETEEVSNNQVIFKATSQIGTESNLSIVACDNPIENDYFIGFYTQNGSCDGSNTGMDTNGTEVIQSYLSQAINEDLDLSSPYPNARIFAGFIETINPMESYPDEYLFAMDYPNPDDNLPGDGIRDYLMYTGGSSVSSSNGCVSGIDLNWYLCNYYNISWQYLAPQDKILAYSFLAWNFLSCGCYYEHYLGLYFGTPIYVSDGPASNPNDPGITGPIDIDLDIIQDIGIGG